MENKDNSESEKESAEKQNVEENTNEKKDKSSVKKNKTHEDPSILPAEQVLPNKLMIIPLSGRPIFPGIFTPLMVNNNDDTKVIEQAYDGDGFIGIVMLKEDKDKPSITDLHDVGTVARIIKKINLPDGGVNVFVSTVKRFRIRKALSSTNPMVAAVDYLDDEEEGTFEVKRSEE